MPKLPQPTKVAVTDYSGRPATVVTLPAEAPEQKSAEHVPRKTKYQQKIGRAQRKQENRKHWKQVHDVELNDTKRLLFDALRLLRRNNVPMPKELSDVLAHHEKWPPGRVGGRRYKKEVHEFESD